jgi:hypothetical protein
MIHQADTTQEFPVYAICKEDLLEQAERVSASNYVMSLIQAAKPSQMEAIAEYVLDHLPDLGDLLEKAVEQVFDLDSLQEGDPAEIIYLDDLDLPDCPLCGSYGGTRPPLPFGKRWFCTNCGNSFGA